MKTEFYRKPDKVEAYQWNGETLFTDKLKQNFMWEEINVNCGPLIEGTHDSQRLKIPSMTIEMKYTTVRGFGSTWEIELGDWLVIDPCEDHALILSNEAFFENYFKVETETRVNAPALEEIL